MRYKYFLAAFLVVLVIGCSKPDMTVLPAPGTMAVSTTINYLTNNFDFSLFAAAAKKCGWADSLGDESSTYTVLAVNNAGFNGMGIYAPADFDRWSNDSLRHFIKTHLFPGRILFNDFPKSLDSKYKNLNGDDLLVSIFAKYGNTGGFYDMAINGVSVAPNPDLITFPRKPFTYGTSLLNGAVYPLWSAIKTSRSDIQTFLASRPDMSIFIAGLKKFGQWERLKTASPITVLAPPDSVFLRYGITADSIGRMDLARYKPAFMDSYIITLNRIFLTDIFTFLNRENASQIPDSYSPLLTLPTSDPNLKLCMLGNYGYLGSFVFDVSKIVYMPDEYGSTYWAYQILGSNATSVPVSGDPSTGYSNPYIGESKRPNIPRGIFINYTQYNGVVHLLNGLLLMPSDVEKP